MEQTFSRRAWVEASAFFPLPEHEAIEQVLAFVEKAVASAPAGQKTIALLDLDSSLYDTNPRTRAIVREWLALPETVTGPVPPAVRAALEKDPHPRGSFSLEDNFSRHGLDTSHPAVRAAHTALQEYWKPRFFDNAYLDNDVPMPGGAAFVRSLAKTGAHLIYLTGRDRPGMEGQTIRNFARDEFPLPGSTHCELWMKAQREGDDHEFKMSWIEKLHGYGNVVLSLENEPRNYVGFLEAFPKALHLFADTVASPAPARAARTSGYRLHHYAPGKWRER